MADDSYVVLSSSMEPELSAGDIVIVKETDIEEIRVGDVVTFDIGEKTVTHRVIEKADDNGIKLLTKGDAMEEADDIRVDENNLIGKVVVSFPFYGYIFLHANTLLGYILLILIPATILIIGEVRKLIKLKKGEENEKKQ
ncbi:MAG: Signal peptidase I LepB [Candidatus Methanohalarchaeum thermophilum]|uniref:Signal peptidase I LepB n=1 Tax=Methanohalarchaeum thermophilum TaxID=1903181 RepID=A0A1Q6DXJ2_METT1|nr:MAG: Signal peptidase I LepB [Candidatus Methanohalarchaeum thermophilum]